MFKIIIWLFTLYFIFRFIGTVFRFLLGSYIKKKMENGGGFYSKTYTYGFPPNNQHTNQRNREGEISIDPNTPSKKANPTIQPDEGEYISYEEVK